MILEPVEIILQNIKYVRVIRRIKTYLCLLNFIKAWLSQTPLGPSPRDLFKFLIAVSCIFTYGNLQMT